jgi:hypothetical protein
VTSPPTEILPPPEPSADSTQTVESKPVVGNPELPSEPAATSGPAPVGSATAAGPAASSAPDGGSEAPAANAQAPAAIAQAPAAIAHAPAAIAEAPADGVQARQLSPPSPSHSTVAAVVHPVTVDVQGPVSDAQPAVDASLPSAGAKVAAVVDLQKASRAAAGDAATPLRPPYASMLVRPDLEPARAPLAALIAPPPVPAAAGVSPVLPRVLPDPAPHGAKSAAEDGDRNLRQVNRAPLPLELPPLHALHEGTAAGGSAGGGSGAAGGLMGVALAAVFLGLAGAGIGRRLRLACQPFLSSYLLSLPARPG